MTRVGQWFDNQPLSDRKKKKSIKLYNPQIFTRTPSRQFNDPIYAGFEINQDNKEQEHWGPWIMTKQSTLRHSHSLHSNIKRLPSTHKIYSFPASSSKCTDLSGKVVIKEQQNSPTRSGLPLIKQKCKPSLFQIKIGFVEQDSKQVQNRADAKLRAKLDHTNSKYSMQRTDQYQRQMKLGTVVYNYCTNNNVDQCLLNYNRKSEQLSRLSKQSQDQMLTTKYEGLKAYWKRRNSNKLGCSP